MKKLFVIVLIISSLFLQGCADFNSGKRPTDYDNTKWVSENPDIYFEVNENFKSVTGTNTYGRIVSGDMMSELTVIFDYGTTVLFKKISSGDDGELLIRGTCEFSSEKLVVKVNDCNEDWLNKSIKKIVFVKKDIR